MKSRGFILAWLTALAIMSPTRNAGATDSELPTGATLLDERTVMYMRPVPLVSPDGRRVAYVSRGHVCVVDAAGGEVRRLVEVPDTWSHVYANFDGAKGGGDANTLARLAPPDKHKELQARVKSEIGEFQWTEDGEAIIFGVRSHDAEKQTTTVRIWRAPLDGEAEVIASSEDSNTARRGLGGVITKDGRFLVANGGGRHRALIWEVATNRPRATPFIYLTPSSTSGRWIGVEKNTRQLVVVDEDFKVVERHEEVLPDGRFGFDMIWSPDERFVFWRQQIGFDYYSNWVGCRLDLQTRQRDIFTGDYMDEEIAFTGFRGEFTRVGGKGLQGPMSGLHLIEQYVGLVPDENMYLRSFWSQRADPPGMASKVRMSMLNVTWSRDLQLFTIGLPRQEGPYGEVYHLADRQRQMWKLPGKDTGRYVSPYRVAGFALDDKVIVAYDDKRLFAVPVAAIQDSENRVR
jgi:hypothetical protein